MTMRFPTLPALALFAALAAPASLADEVTLDDLKAIVAEFETVVPENPAYTYPIEVSILESEEVNAGAGVRVEEGVLYATLEVNTGFVEAVGGDPAKMRAVIAHEMAHLALGHAIEGFDEGDLDHALTRQEEFAADATGVLYLEKLGYEKAEMIELLRFLDSLIPRGFPVWLGTVGSDHASPVVRAGLVEGDSKILAALARLETGAAFMECRRYEEAVLWFEAALELEPRMQEAYIDIALASLQDYYERLPLSVQEEWLQPAFLPHLTTTSLLGGRAVEITDKDLARYKRVLARIDAIPDGMYNATREFILGTLQVLEPTGDKDTILTGTERLKGNQLLSFASLPLPVQQDQLRLANNIALGMARLDDHAGAQEYLVHQSLKSPSIFIRAAAENMGRLPSGKLPEEGALQVINNMITYIENTPPSTPNYSAVRDSLNRLLDSLHRKLSGELATQDLYLCQAIAIRVDGEEVGLFESIDDAAETLGTPTAYGFLLEKYPDLACALFGVPDVVLLTERGQILKITSYRAGSAIELKPTNSTSRDLFHITVGMDATDLDAMLASTGNQDANIETMVFGRAAFIEGALPETWNYYPALNLGVLIEDGKVVGISVTPVKA
jgi:tetratricopeptide (TPR) repeat protein